MMVHDQKKIMWQGFFVFCNGWRWLLLLSLSGPGDIDWRFAGHGWENLWPCQKASQQRPRDHCKQGHDVLSPYFSFDDAHAIACGVTKSFACFWGPGAL